MALSIPNTFTAGTTIEAADVNENFSAVASTINGQLTQANLASDAAIPNSKLANSKYETVVGITLVGTERNGSTSTNWIFPAMPYDSTEGNTSYTILAIESMTMTVGAVTAMVADLYYGNATDGWTTIKSGITSGTATTQTAYSSFSTSTITTSSTRPKFFRLDVTTAGVSFAATDSFSLAVKLSRANGLRS